ncbi:hypothetical protein ABEB36_004202 [Hypothenemus hampei]|uniref:beta-N-acetylhexosaminidase n=1 Tax=Hypothenemus hampei TaxID=57062 RepID=A0ABD1F2J6_HYPHA
MDQERKSFDSCIHKLVSWRRKKRIFIIMLLVFLMIAIFGVQFYHIKQKGHLSPELSQKEDDTFMQSIKVKFIEAAKLNSQEHLRKNNRLINIKDIEKLKKIDQPSHTEKNVEAFETNQQLGIPRVLTIFRNPYIPKHRIVHFDLKGAPPTIIYLKKIMSLIKNVGATGILLEYEDMFPYTGILAPIAAKNAYTFDQVIEILQYAQELQLEVIPLIQTFGHMEFALKHRIFSGSREVPGSPQALCPNRNSSLDLIRELVNQILHVHSNIHYLHIGCDEVFEMGECEICRTEIRENLFLKHVHNVVNIVRASNSKIKVIIWDDMLRHIAVQNLQAANIGDQVEPMVWVYAEDIYRFVQPPIWEKYTNVFNTAWTASAFKGAFGEAMYIPNARRHLENNLRWLEVMATQSDSFKQGLRGIVLTGWQRYDHFAILCELLPAAVPSLILNLLATTNGYFNATFKDQFLNSLSCPYPNERKPRPFLNLEGDPNMWEKLARCMFPGHAFFRLMYRLHNLEQEARDYVDSTTRQKGWLTAYNVKYNYSLPLRVDELTQDLPRVYHGLVSLARNAAESLKDIVDNYTISEWIEQRVYPYMIELENIQNASIALKKVKFWPARPLPIFKDLQKHGIAIG